MTKHERELLLLIAEGMKKVASHFAAEESRTSWLPMALGKARRDTAQEYVNKLTALIEAVQNDSVQ